jgi:hypothetical protein
MDASVLALAEHVKRGQLGQRVTCSPFTQQEKAALCSARSQPNTSKVAPHITRPGTSCMRTPISDRLPVKGTDLQSIAQATLPVNHTLGKSEQGDIRAVWTPEALVGNVQKACPARRIASSPIPVLAHAASEEAVWQAPALPGCCTAPVHTLTALQGGHGSADLSEHDMDWVKVCAQVGASISAPHITVGDRNRSQVVSSHTMNMGEGRSPPSRTVQNPHQGAISDWLPHFMHE